MSIFGSGEESSFGKIMTLTMEGRAALSMQDGEKAYQKLSEKHELILKAFGPEAGPTATSLIDLAEAAFMKGSIKEARKYIDEAFAIFKKLDRNDEMSMRLENALLDICRRQGHFFIMESVCLESIEKSKLGGSDQDFNRVIMQDHLAEIYINQQKYDKAQPLLFDSLQFFEKQNLDEEASITSLYLARTYHFTNQHDIAELYGHKALKFSENIHGTNSISSATLMDELSISKGYIALKNESTDKALESIECSNNALEIIVNLTGSESKEYQRSKFNHEKLKQMIEHLLPPGSTELKTTPKGQTTPLPTYLFISHAYADKDSLKSLLNTLPAYVEPVIFEAIRVPPTEQVSEKLISGILGSEGLIWIDSEISKSSFWTAFEKDLALRKQKHIFRFDPKSKSITPFKAHYRNLQLVHLFHPDDTADVNNIIVWLIEQRSFDVFDNPKSPAHDPKLSLSQVESKKREFHLLSLRSFGIIYLIFITESLIQNDDLFNHTLYQLNQYPESTMVCWLDDPKNMSGSEKVGKLVTASNSKSYKFTTKPSHASFNRHQLDNLMVRLFWMRYNQE